MAVYDRQTATALRMIAAKGEAITWISRGEPVGGTPAKPTARPETPYPAKMVFFPNTRTSFGYDEGAEAGTEIRSGGIMGYMGRVEFEPLNGDLVIRASGEQLTVRLRDGIEILAPNGEVILYTVYFER